MGGQGHNFLAEVGNFFYDGFVGLFREPESDGGEVPLRNGNVVQGLYGEFAHLAVQVADREYGGGKLAGRDGLFALYELPLGGGFSQKLFLGQELQGICDDLGAHRPLAKFRKFFWARVRDGCRQLAQSRVEPGGVILEQFPLDSTYAVVGENPVHLFQGFLLLLGILGVGVVHQHGEVFRLVAL